MIEVSSSIFPTNRISFPIFVNISPFEGEYKYDFSCPLDTCPKCHLPYTFNPDNSDTYFSCPFCNNVQKIDIKKLQNPSQLLYNSFRSQVPAPSYQYYFLFCIDSRCSKDEFQKYLSFLQISIDSLPDNYPFLLCFLCVDHIRFISYSNHLIVINIPYTSSMKIQDFISFSNLVLTPKEYPNILNYIHSLTNCESHPLYDVTSIFNQFTMPEPNNFFMIVYFSDILPPSAEIYGLCINWITQQPVPSNIPKTIGLKLFSSVFSDEANVKQIHRLVNSLSTNSPIFNVSIQMNITNYNIENKNQVINGSAAIQNFSKLLKLEPISSDALNIFFEVHTKCIHFIPMDGSSISFIPYIEDLVQSQTFSSSSDFFAISNSTIPDILIPSLIKYNILKKTIVFFFQTYKSHMSKIPSDEDNPELSYFSMTPKLQWLLKVYVHISKFPPQENYPILSCPFCSKFALFYPKISLWYKTEKCLNSFCTYEMLKTGPLANIHVSLKTNNSAVIVVDKISSITVYKDVSIEMNSESNLSVFLNRNRCQRFPEPEIYFEEINQFYRQFPQNTELQELAKLLN